MDRTSISRRIGSIKGDIEKLSNTLCAIEKTDIENYPDNYAMLTTDAALRSELIACRMRHLLYGSTATRKETYLASAGVVQGIRIKAQENMLEITLPCLLPKRKQRQSTEFLIDPLYFTLSQYSDNNELPKFRQCVVCFSHIYSEYHDGTEAHADKEMLAALWVLTDFIDRVDYHSSTDFPVKLIFIADGELYEVIYVETGGEALIEHAVAKQPDDAEKRIVIVESAEQIGKLNIPDVTAYCTVDMNTGAVQYYKQE